MRVNGGSWTSVALTSYWAADFAGNWQAELGPGVVNWTFGANGALSGIAPAAFDWHEMLLPVYAAVAVLLAGLPPSAGFLAKLWLLQSLPQAASAWWTST